MAGSTARPLAAAALVAGLLAPLFALDARPGRAPRPEVALRERPEAPAAAGPPAPQTALPARTSGAPAPPAAGSPTPPAQAPPSEVGAAEPGLTLERLLTWSDPEAPPGLDLRPAREPAAGPGSPGERAGSSVYLERASESHGPTTREEIVERTEVGVRVPVDSSVDLRGGVRVDSREDARTGERDSKTTPTVGVEVRF